MIYPRLLALSVLFLSLHVLILAVGAIPEHKREEDCRGTHYKERQPLHLHNHETRNDYYAVFCRSLMASRNLQ